MFSIYWPVPFSQSGVHVFETSAKAVQFGIDLIMFKSFIFDGELVIIFEGNFRESYCGMQLFMLLLKILLNIEIQNFYQF